MDTTSTTVNESTHSSDATQQDAGSLRILFLSRAYPPVTGGIENMNYELSMWLPRIAQVTTIANTRGKKFLPIFLPYATLRALCIASRYDVILLGDGVLSIVGYILKKIYPNTSVVCIVHGLDITFTSSIYQRFWVQRFLPALNKLIAVGNETIRVGVERNIPEKLFTFIPNGISSQKFFHPHTRNELSTLLGESLDDKYVLLTSGRLAKRKGVAWFIRNVLPLLPENILYVVAGDGADKENIVEAIKISEMSHRVRLLGFVSDAKREILLNTCDIFVQPNIRVQGDMEGFGISVIEAASCGIPVVASQLEGLVDALHNTVSGILVEPEQPEAFATAITKLLENDDARRAFGLHARNYVLQHFDWSTISKKYLETLRSTLK